MYFEYCPECKAKLPKAQARGRLLNCKKCGFVFYFSPSVGVNIILVNEKGEVLLAKRAFAPKKGSWNFIGGFVEFDEAVEDAVRREAKEELGLNLGALRYFNSYPSRYCYRNVNYHTLVFVFYGLIKTQEFHPTDDVSEVKFFALDKLPADKSCFSGAIRILRDYKRSL